MTSAPAVPADDASGPAAPCGDAQPSHVERPPRLENGHHGVTVRVLARTGDARIVEVE